MGAHRKEYEDKIGYINGNGYRRVEAKGHPLANNNQKNPRVAQHRLILWDKIGPGPHLCHWDCGKTVEWNGPTGIFLDVDHVDGNKLNNQPDNLVPACHRCNTVRSLKPKTGFRCLKTKTSVFA